MNQATIYVGNVLEQIKNIADASVQCVVTSPPYWGLRDYGHDDQIGLESTPEAYVANMVEVFREVRRILKDDGVLWLNLGDSYAGNNSRASNNGRAGFGAKREGVFTKSGQGLKPKDLVGIPWRVAFALQSDGWWLRQDIIWHKSNPMPESVTDRCTRSHEYVFMLTKSQTYFYDAETIKEPTKYPNEVRRFSNKDPNTFRNDNEQMTIGEKKNKRSVWSINTKPFKGAHFAVMPEKLVEPCVLATSKPNDLVFDPFTGSGTVAVVALNNQRNFVGTELNPDYAQIARNRITNTHPMFCEVIVVNDD
jgi:DNA modification methylase